MCMYVCIYLDIYKCLGRKTHYLAYKYMGRRIHYLA